MPRNKYPEETREKIIEAGLKTFQEKGYEAATILDIVANMGGLTRGAFYHHFKSKEEVFTAICENIFESNNPFFAVHREKNLTGMEKLRKAMKLNMSTQQTDFEVLNSAGDELFNSPLFFKWIIDFNASLCHKYVQPIITEGIADGSIMEQDPRILAELFTVMFSFWISPVIFSGDTEYMEKKSIAAFTILEQFGLTLYDEEMEELGLAWIDEHKTDAS
jgi:AcrR family transcriptional regulator